jgi:hypothetical protein
MHPSVKEADRAMCRFEGGREVKGINWGPTHPALSNETIGKIDRWQPWSWKSSEEVFLGTARMLGVDC